MFIIQCITAVLFGLAPSPESTRAAGDLVEDDAVARLSKPRTRTPGLPSGLRGHATAFDGARGEWIVFGGRANGIEFASTWRSGRRAQAGEGPCARHGHAMVWDASRERIVLFGGRAAGRELNDTWEWDGRAWKRCASESAPPPRRLHALAYDAKRARVVLFGGVRSRHGMLNDTWEWDGSTWRCVETERKPSKRIRHSLSFDPRRGRVLLFGGYGRGELDAAWVFDGRSWQRRHKLSAAAQRARR